MHRNEHAVMPFYETSWSSNVSPFLDDHLICGLLNDADSLLVAMASSGHLLLTGVEKNLTQ
jgi:hypothetical protein